MWQLYFTPASIDEAVELLDRYKERASVIAGGTDLVLELRKEIRKEVEVLVDISRIPGLDQINIDRDGWIHVGPLVTHNQCINSELLRKHAFALSKACLQIAAPQIRNRGTVVGNIVTASPANDTIAPLMVFDAVLKLRSKNGERSMLINEFYTGVRKTVLRSDEIVAEIAFKAQPENAKSAFHKMGLRNAQAISVVNAAVNVEFDGKNVRNARIALGSVAPVVVRAAQAEQYLIGKPLIEDVINTASELAAKSVQPISDVRSSSQYRLAMVKVFVARALRDIVSGKEQADFPEKVVKLWGVNEHHVTDELSESLVHETGTPIITKVNGKTYTVIPDHNKTLLHLLREDLGLVGAKDGCSEGECGACTIIMDGKAVLSCLIPAPCAHGREIVTIEGLAQNGQLHSVQKAFIEEGAVQCGYCTPGFVMATVKLLEEVPCPDETQIRQALSGNLCRCTGYYKIISAVENATKR